ncbi:type II secretion system F family protein [Myxococcota bacterium]|nr:type II secretion system F family protein [Myxococcota bacterium]
MPAFIYEGRTATGELKKGEVEAESQAAAMTRLRSMQIKPTTVKKKTILNMDLSVPMPRFLGGGVGERDLVIFTRQFATMIDSGLPLVQCLEIQAQQVQNPVFRKELVQIKEAVEGGATFADALKKFPETFDELFVNLIAAGEIGGILDTILNRLAAYIEKNSKLRKQVKSALTYPATVLVVAGIVVGFLMIKVIPVFDKMFSDMGATLPLPTQIVVNLSHRMQDYFLYFIAGLVLAIVAIRQALKIRSVRYAVHKVALKSPLIGDLLTKVAVARFCRTLSTMISSGVPILDALEICSKTAGNLVIEGAVIDIRDAISEGKTIAEPLAKAKVFPGMVCQMIAVGESTGALDTMLGKIADFYEDEVEAAVGALTSMIEPVLMVFLGGTVGFLVIAMYLPIFTMASALSGG